MSWLDKNQNKILIGIWSVIVLTCLLVILSDSVNAASPNSLPYIVDNNISVEDFANVFNGHPHQTNYTLTISEDNCFIFEITSNGTTYYYVYVPKKVQVPTRVSDPYSFYVSYLSVPYAGFNTSSDSAIISASNYACALFYVNGSGNVVYNTVYLTENISRGLSIFYNSSYTPVYICREVLDSSENVVLGLSSNTVSDSGHASEPVDEHGHYIEDNNGNRIPKPNKPSPTVYTPPTIQFPNVDTSSLEKLLESLIDLVQYFISYIGGVINGWFSNLFSNLDSWFDYVVQSFNYAVNNIVGAIKDLVQTFYNNMVSLFEPLYEFFNGVASFFNSLIELGSEDGSFSIGKFLTSLIVPDSEDLANALIDADIHGSVPFILSVKTAFTNIFNNLSNLTPTKVFILPTFTWHNQTYNLSIDFSWYDNYKVYGDTIISGFLILFYLHWVYLNISSTLRGGSAIGHDLSKGGQ